jgi:hypothetical protein
VRKVKESLNIKRETVTVTPYGNDTDYITAEDFYRVYPGFSGLVRIRDTVYVKRGSNILAGDLYLSDSNRCYWKVRR